MNALQILRVLIIIKRVFFFFFFWWGRGGGELKMGLKPQALFGGDEVHLG